MLTGLQPVWRGFRQLLEQIRATQPRAISWGCVSGWEQQGTAPGTEAAEQLRSCESEAAGGSHSQNTEVLAKPHARFSVKEITARVVPQPGAQSPFDQLGSCRGRAIPAPSGALTSALTATKGDLHVIDPLAAVFPVLFFH